MGEAGRKTGLIGRDLVAPEVPEGDPGLLAGLPAGKRRAELGFAFIDLQLPVVPQHMGQTA